MNQAQLNPIAVLAAVLFSVNKTEVKKVKADDSQEEIEVMSACMGIEQKDDALVCIIPIEKIVHFMQTQYNFKMKVDAGYALLSFEKVANKPVILSTNGEQIASESEVIQQLTDKLTSPRP